MIVELRENLSLPNSRLTIYIEIAIVPLRRAIQPKWKEGRKEGIKKCSDIKAEIAALSTRTRYVKKGRCGEERIREKEIEGRERGREGGNPSN